MSSNDVAIAVRGLSKQYKIQHAGAKYVTLAETLLHRVKNGLRSTTNETFWALKDVSFEVKRGEVLGVIGRNGAGKSTLLKVMSRITEPTEGEVEMHGRVGSLLEVGTGFHPELTGRENIFLNGAILGMKRSEIQRQFDAIVDFAEVEKFLDTPVKRYSSGMYTRLAFSVAAHLQPEILIVDEVLSVGDAQFQQKCLGKMKDVAGQGRTVLFVSHNMGAVRNLCESAIWLDKGGVRLLGKTGEIVSEYATTAADGALVPDLDLTSWPDRYGSGEVRITHARLLDQENKVCSTLQRIRPAAIEFTLRSTSRSRLNLSATCMTLDGIKVLQLAHQDDPRFRIGALEGEQTVRIDIPSLPLQCGRYQWALAIHTPSLQPVDVVRGTLTFNVEDDFSAGGRPYLSTAEHGLCSLIANWQFVGHFRSPHAIEQM